MGFLFRLFHGGFDRDGYDREGYSRKGYKRDGYNRDGYDRYGYDREGYSPDGYKRNGYNRKGYDRYGYGKDGFNNCGYDKYGYNRKGYNRDGYNRDGYNRDGYNRDGYKRDGYNDEGYDFDGYDRDGYNRKGFSRDGYDRYGYDNEGYDRYGFNKEIFNMWPKAVIRSNRTLLDKTYYDFITRNKDRSYKCPNIEFYSPVKKNSSGLGESILLIDLHGLHLKDAREIIDIIIDSVSAQVGMIMVVHGYKSGQVIRDMLQYELKHVKIKKIKRDKNPGRTLIYLHPNSVNPVQ